MLCDDFDKAVAWVQARIPDDVAVSSGTLQLALQALDALSRRASATFLIPDLFPGVALETLYLHDGCKHCNDTSPTNTVPTGISPGAMTAIGTAILSELRSQKTELLTCPLEGNTEVIVFIPEIRSVVLKATGTTLLSS